MNITLVLIDHEDTEPDGTGGEDHETYTMRIQDDRELPIEARASYILTTAYDLVWQWMAMQTPAGERKSLREVIQERNAKEVIDPPFMVSDGFGHFTKEQVERWRELQRSSSR